MNWSKIIPILIMCSLMNIVTSNRATASAPYVDHQARDKAFNQLFEVICFDALVKKYVADKSEIYMLLYGENGEIGEKFTNSQNADRFQNALITKACSANNLDRLKEAYKTAACHQCLDLDIDCINAVNRLCKKYDSKTLMQLKNNLEGLIKKEVWQDMCSSGSHSSGSHSNECLETAKAQKIIFLLHQVLNIIKTDLSSFIVGLINTDKIIAVITPQLDQLLNEEMVNDLVQFLSTESGKKCILVSTKLGEAVNTIFSQWLKNIVNNIETAQTI